MSSRSSSRQSKPRNSIAVANADDGVPSHQAKDLLLIRFFYRPVEKEVEVTQLHKLEGGRYGYTYKRDRSKGRDPKILNRKGTRANMAATVFNTPA